VPDLSFTVESAAPVAFAAAPQLALTLRIASDAPVQALALRCQVQLDAPARRYDAAEQAALGDLWARDRFHETLRPLLWTQVNMTVPAFDAQTTIELVLPCSYDFNLATTKYFHALKGGAVPLTLLFSGTIFHHASDGKLQVAPVPWEKEAAWRLPVATWQQMMEQHYPNQLFFALRKDVFNRLYEYKTQHALPTFEQAIARLLERDP
jgi:Family of unknown function (DUF6084)